MQAENILSFIDAYRRQENYYRDLAQTAARLLESQLDAQGVRALVTSRSKSVDRLRDKLDQRKGVRKYETHDDIRADVRDLAGVRVALYFPNDTESVQAIIESLFRIDRKDELPKLDTNKYGRFPGYCALHYVVRLKEDLSEKFDVRYFQDAIEVQIATVFMHAWAEVEHDLRYKPTTGALSDEELLILEQLNGLALTAETALRNLQGAVTRRASGTEAKLENHFELAALLSKLAAEANTQFAKMPMGRADVLYHLLKTINKLSVDDVAALFQRVGYTDEDRSIVDGLVDLLLYEDDKLAEAFARAREAAGPGNPYEPIANAEDTRGEVRFLRLWQLAESATGALLPNQPRVGSRSFLFNRPELFEYLMHDERPPAKMLLDLLNSLVRARQIRNRFVHNGVAIPKDLLHIESERLNQFISNAIQLMTPEKQQEFRSALMALP